jgi:hypothetical protein
MPVQTPNMNLQQPIIGQDSGLTWEQSTNSNADVIDAHNHSPGSGTQINPSGININSSLPFNNQKATTVAAVEFQDQSAITDTTSAYTKSGNLFFRDGSGNEVQITSGGAVNATSSGISSGTATASFVSSTLVVNADVNKPANVKGASLLMGNNVTSSHYLTLQPPAAMAADTTVTLPSIPGSQSFMTIDTSGNMAGYASINQGITRSNLASVGQQVSSSSGSAQTASAVFVDVTNLSVSITSTGRPIIIMFIPDTSGNGYFGASNTGSGTATAGFQLLRGVSTIAATIVAASSSASTGSIFVPPGCMNYIDVVSAGTYTYKLQYRAQFAQFAVAFGVIMIAYEL